MLACHHVFLYASIRVCIHTSIQENKYACWQADLFACFRQVFNLGEMIISCINEKGGVGKTTIAVHLTGWLKKGGIDVALVDSDVQGGSSLWLSEADPDIPVHRFLSHREMVKGVDALKHRNRQPTLSQRISLTEWCIIVSRTCREPSQEPRRRH